MANMMLEEEIKNMMYKLQNKRKMKGGNHFGKYKDGVHQGGKMFSGLQTQGISLKNQYDVYVDEDTNMLKGNHSSKRSKTQN